MMSTRFLPLFSTEIRHFAAVILPERELGEIEEREHII